MAEAFVKLKKGGWLKVPSYDAFSYEDQTIYVGYYRNTGWIPLQTPLTATVVVEATTVLRYSRIAPATGIATEPDEQAHTAPRFLNWKETKLKFTLAGRVVAEVYWKDLISWSNTAPQDLT